MRGLSLVDAAPRCVYIERIETKRREQQMHTIATAIYNLFDRIQLGLMWLFDIEE